MSGDIDQNSNAQQDDFEGASDVPKYNLYIKASLIDQESKGACPVCQQHFMLSYLLAQNQNAFFRVYTINADAPPKEFTQDKKPGMYPFIEGVSGQDKSGMDISGMRKDAADELEKFYEAINFTCPHLKRPANQKTHILGKVDNMSTKMNAFLNGNASPDTVNKILKIVDDHLGEKTDDGEPRKFLDGEELSYVDCFFLPRLQHLRIAGKFFRNYDIPDDYVHLWRYLRDAYKTDAFRDCLASDEDIIKFYLKKMPPRRPPYVATGNGIVSLEIPASVEERLARMTNGRVEEDHADKLPEPDEQMQEPDQVQDNGEAEQAVE